MLALVLVASGGFALDAVTAPPASAEAGVEGTSVQIPQRWYSYVSPGERFQVRSAFRTNTGANGGDLVTKWVVYAPDGEVAWECNQATGAGKRCDWEGPVQTEAGVWVAALEPARGSHPNNHGRNIVTWQINPLRGNSTVPGRTWSERFDLTDSATVPSYPMWVQTEFGYTYEVEYRGLRGITSAFQASAFGNVNGTTCASVYHSLASGANNPKPDFGPVSWKPQCGAAPDKVFFGKPNLDGLPRVVTLPGGATTWLNVPLEKPELRVQRFTPDFPGSRAGLFTFVASGFEGNIEIRIDTDGDGDFAGPKDIVTRSAIYGGQGRFRFDGRDAAGAEIPTSTPIAFRVGIEKLGETHFLLGDVEILSGGMKVTRLNGLQSSGSTIVHWNDEPVTLREWDRQANIKCGTLPSPLRSPEEGVDSNGGVRGWSATGCKDMNGSASSTTNGGSWGNNRSLDTWAYERFDLNEPGAPVVTMDIPGFAVTKDSVPASGVSVSPGEVVNYTVTASAVPYSHPEQISQPANFWNGRLSDTITGVTDDADVDLDALTQTPSAQELGGAMTTIVTRDDNRQWTWTGTGIPVETAVSVNYSAVVKPLEQGGDGALYNVAFAHLEETPPPFPEGCPVLDNRSLATCGWTEHPVDGLSFEKSSTPLRETAVLPGEEITYTLSFANNGQNPVAINHVDDMNGLTDDVDLNDFSVDRVTITPGDATLVPTWNADTHRMGLTGTLEPGQSVQLTYSVTVGARTGDGVIANFLLRAGEARPAVCVEGNRGCTVHFVPSLEIKKTFLGDYEDLDGSGSIRLGDLVPFAFTVTNGGATAIEQIQVIDPLVQAQGVGVRCETTRLRPGQSTTCVTEAGYEIQAADVEAGSVTNSATVRGIPTNGARLTSAESAATVNVERVEPGLSIVKSLDDDNAAHPGGGDIPAGVEDVNDNGRVDAGDRVWYAFTVTNTGDTRLEEVRVIDDKLTEAGIAIDRPSNTLNVGQSIRCVSVEPWIITEAEAADGAVENVARAEADNATTELIEAEPSDHRLSVDATVSPSPSPSVTVSPTPTPTPTVTVSPTSSPAPTVTVSPTSTPSPTDPGTISPTPTVTATLTPDPSEPGTPGPTIGPGGTLGETGHNPPTSGGILALILLLLGSGALVAKRRSAATSRD
ncbi:DUF11 domain-containing protein [Mycetocola tolaasinivorans]|uniref:DUF11 domain-containing protein n=1 Tax=Mycetocola tolaasinivorans TaxID=76635 RepID=A0A3L6ZZV0_9MICO|nr:DUF11 domain-containing protein [Mycetocola tolaasinivorans]RLP73344.1 DUF11 domain-containing protein [Mycetocola tolaasinivorans]